MAEQVAGLPATDASKLRASRSPNISQRAIKSLRIKRHRGIQGQVSLGGDHAAPGCQPSEKLTCPFFPHLGQMPDYVEANGIPYPAPVALLGRRVVVPEPDCIPNLVPKSGATIVIIHDKFTIAAY